MAWQQNTRIPLNANTEDNAKLKTMRKKKSVQLTPQQLHQFHDGSEGPPISPRASAASNDLDGEGQLNVGSQDQQASQEHPPVNFNVFPYYYDVVKNHRLLKSSNLKDQIRGAQELGEVAWNGGELSQSFIGKCGVLKTFNALLDTDPALKFKIIQALSVVCRGNLEIQEQLVELNFVQKLFAIMCDHNEELRKWATHTMFYLLNDCERAHTVAHNISELKHRLEIIQKDNWTSWHYNDAKEILRMLRLNAFDD